MRRFHYLTAGAALCAALTIGTAKPAHANACQTLMCMSGLVGNGSPAGGCSSHITKYFSIIRFGMWGYSPSRTAAARQRYLMSCEGAALNMEWVSMIQAVYGTVP